MTNRSALFALLLLVSALPSVAGTVYLPVVDDFAGADEAHQFQLLLTNTDLVPRSFSALFLPTGSDGTQRESLIASPVQVAPGATFVFQVDPSQNGTGLLEVEADTALALSARILTVEGEELGPERKIELPTISSQSFFQPGGFAHLQGLDRDPEGTKSNVTIANLGHDPSICAVRVFRADGSQILTTVFLAFQPLSQRLFKDAFASLQELSVADARVEVSCNQPFYAFATVVDPDLSAARVIQPSVLGDSTLAIPREAPDPVEFVVNGTFLQAKKGSSSRLFKLPLETDHTYRQVTVEFTFHLDRFHSDLFHNVIEMRRQGQPLYFGVFLRGDNGKTIVDLGDDSTLKHTGEWKENRTYHVVITYDVEVERLSFKAMRGNKLIESFSGPLSHTDLRSTETQSINLVFGSSKVFDNAYFPPWGWSFSNLKVTAVP